MKKRTLLSVFCLFIFASLTFAQTAEQQAQKERMAKLEKLSQPKACGLANVNNLVNESGAMAKEALIIAPLLEDISNRALSTEANVTKPTLEECIELSIRIEKQATATKGVTEKMKSAMDEIKGTKNPIELKKANSCMNYVTDALSITTEETVYEGQVIANVIKALQGK